MCTCDKVPALWLTVAALITALPVSCQAITTCAALWTGYMLTLRGVLAALTSRGVPQLPP